MKSNRNRDCLSVWEYSSQVSEQPLSLDTFPNPNPNPHPHLHLFLKQHTWGEALHPSLTLS